MKEEDIRPKRMWEKYKSLAERDSERIFKHCDKVTVSCFGCDSTQAKEIFEKDGFCYQVCLNCNTIFLNPRPLRKYFEDFYTNGESVKFWSTDFYPLVEKQRKEKIYSPRVERIKHKLNELGMGPKISLVDIGCGYGSFLEEVRNRNLDDTPAGIEPNRKLAQICRDKGFKISESSLEDIQDLQSTFDIAIAFEVLEHLCEPEVFINKAYDLLKPNGILLMTSLSSSGYDFKMLGKYHDNLKPPHHINFFNPQSAEKLFTRCGFKNIEIETPGKLDVNILCNRVSDFPWLLKDRLFRAVYEGDEELKNAFQEFLAANNLSSHMWIWSFKN